VNGPPIDATYEPLDRYRLEEGHVCPTGVQARVRSPLRPRDTASGLATSA